MQRRVRRPRESGIRRSRRASPLRIGATRPELRGIQLEIGILNRDNRSARARQSPARTACPLPRLRSPWITLISGFGRMLSSAARVPSVEPSLTTMISRAAGSSMCSSRSMTIATVPASLKTGTMMETSGVVASVKRESSLAQRRASLSAQIVCHGASRRHADAPEKLIFHGARKTVAATQPRRDGRTSCTRFAMSQLQRDLR